MLVLLEGWNYVMELYFWVILAAILLVSMTILLARPSQSKYSEENEYNMEESSGTEEASKGAEDPEEMDDQEEEEEKPEEEIEMPPEVTKKQWAISFAIFGLKDNLTGSKDHELKVE